MVTAEIRFFVDNIMNSGNLLGLDRATIDVYLAEGIRSDEEPDLVLHVDSYTVLGGFLEALMIKMFRDSMEGGIGGVDWIISEYKSFVENIKDYEREIIAHTKRYFDKINNVADVIRGAGRKVRVYLSEISSGVELYFSGRSEILKNHISRKINELSTEGIENIAVLSPFEYSIYQRRYAIQASMLPFKLFFYPDLIMDIIMRVSADGIRVTIFEPYIAPLSLFPLDLKSYTVEHLERIEKMIESIRGVSIVEHRYDDPPIGYEQLWMINPIISINMAKEILERSREKCDVLVTMRTSTCMVLNVARELYGIDIRTYDYADFVSKLILGAEL